MNWRRLLFIWDVLGLVIIVGPLALTLIGLVYVGIRAGINELLGRS